MGSKTEASVPLDGSFIRFYPGTSRCFSLDYSQQRKAWDYTLEFSSSSHRDNLILVAQVIATEESLNGDNSAFLGV